MQRHKRTRRALSTVVGAVFFIIAATTVISYISYSMNSIDQFSQSVIVAETENINRSKESITISQISIVGGEFNMTVVNTGSLPVHLTRLWVTDEDTTASDKKINLDIRINPGKEKYNIGQGTGVLADPTVSYTLKAVTSRGNVATFGISPDVSTSVRLLVPGSAINEETFGVTLWILNNSTTPNDIVDLEPILTSNVTLTQIGKNQSNVASLKTGETVSFTWKYQSPLVSQGISFKGTYVGAPSGAFDISNTTIYDITEAQSVTTSQWAEKARKVGILISGIPSPIDSTGSQGLTKFGIGIINPLQRPVFVYAVAINTITAQIFDKIQDITPIEPLTGWDMVSKTGHSVVYWEAGTGPAVTIEPESVGQFRVIIDVKAGNLDLLEAPIMIEALTSEGKLTIMYNISIKFDYPTLNVYYTTDPTSSASPDSNWGYRLAGIQSGIWKIFNATVENSSPTYVLQPNATARIKMTILIPSDFTHETMCNCPFNSDWTIEDPIVNPDGSVFLAAIANEFLGVNSDITFQFNATAPTVSNDSLYVFQTTTYYPGWDKPQITSALSEAGVEVVPVT